MDFGHGVRRFLSRSGICLEWFNEQARLSLEIPRFVWLNPQPPFVWNKINCHRSPQLVQQTVRQAHEKSIEFIQKHGGYPLGWKTKEMKNMWAMAQERTLSEHPMYRAGAMFGIDCASVYTIDVLEPKPGESVLDMCCAPGAKLLLLANRLERHGELTGLDVSHDRLGTCVGISRKYRTGASRPSSASNEEWLFRVLEGDGTSALLDNHTIRWDSALDRVLFSNRVGCRICPDEFHVQAPRSRMTRKTREMVANTRKAFTPSDSFDKVIVDTQCTHEGSVRHMVKHLEEENSVWSPRILDELFNQWTDEMDKLQALQRRLIQRGFELLKPGGTMVYSTCSFSRLQNEDIVLWLLDTERFAQLEHIDVGNTGAVQGFGETKDKLASESVPFRRSTVLKETIYFDPETSGTSGLFCAKITKKTNYS
mmetsp:Transcript_31634/g.50503  ORF Transcript_31634/g.50503 Transcript_31634/m.50503 type:complete len:424 (-) Transcript_31634:2668-3939(-)